MVHINDNINQPPSHYIKILMSCPNEKIKIFNVLVGCSSTELLFSVTVPKGKDGVFFTGVYVDLSAFCVRNSDVFFCVSSVKLPFLHTRKNILSPFGLEHSIHGGRTDFAYYQL